MGDGQRRAREQFQLRSVTYDQRISRKRRDQLRLCASAQRNHKLGIESLTSLGDLSKYSLNLILERAHGSVNQRPAIQFLERKGNGWPHSPVMPRSGVME